MITAIVGPCAEAHDVSALRRIESGRSQWCPASAATAGKITSDGELSWWRREGLQPHQREDCTERALTYQPKALNGSHAGVAYLTIPLWIRWEEFLGRHLPSLHNLTFVQIGANCGMNHVSCAGSGDPLWEYATRCGWRGVAVEPTLYSFVKLCAHYAPFRGITPLRAAVSNSSGSLDLLAFAPRPHHGYTLTEMNRRYNPDYDKVIDGANVETVPMVSFAAIWSEARGLLRGAAVDLLVIDVEGMESLLLCAPLPLPLPRLILFEHKNLRAQQHACISENMRAHGFQHVADFMHQERAKPGGRCTARTPCAPRSWTRNNTWLGTDRLYGRPGGTA